MDAEVAAALMAGIDPPATVLERIIAAQPPWMADAACREHPDVSWFPELGQSTEQAKDICSRCLVLGDCLAHALGDETLAGIWGGASPRERAELRRHQRAA